MHLLLCLTVGPRIPVTYQNQIADQVKIWMPDAIVYDCDNHSEGLVIRYAIDLLAESAKACVLIQVTESTSQEPIHATDLTSLGNLRLLFEKLLQQSFKIKVVCAGTHPIVERMLSLLPATVVSKNLNEIQQVSVLETFLRENGKE